MVYLQFIFSSFWVFAGVVILITATGSALAEIINAIRKD